ncbi:MAG: ATP synthase F0 subunit B [Desulfobacterales bacterium]|nr:MAG: ATP synthase F0 subunit B [Desulfobacterales bacterium]UCG05035.1 MAG: ATP synthase F0 subunit B [Desulfobacterales bacterium]
MQIVSNIALITINETLIVQLISFLLFLFIINRVMFRPLRKVISERNAYIEILQQEIADQQNELKKISIKIREREQKILREAHSIVIKQEDDGNLEAAEIIDATRHEIEALKDKTTKEINHRIMEVDNQLKNESDAIVLRIMEKILDRRLAA